MSAAPAPLSGTGTRNQRIAARTDSPRSRRLLSEALAAAEQRDAAKRELHDALAAAREAHDLRRRANAASRLADRRLADAVGESERTAGEAERALLAYGRCVYGEAALADACGPVAPRRPRVTPCP